MSIRSDSSTVTPPNSALGNLEISPTGALGNDHVAATITAAQSADSALGEANSLATTHPDHPLRRTFVASIRATLGDLCLRKQKSTWSPSTEALRSILQQSKFTDLSGTAEMSGDLKSVVLHSLTMASVKSDFDVPIGVKLTGVDNSTFSLTGEAYSAIVPPNTASTSSRLLQKDDVALGAFARPLPSTVVCSSNPSDTHTRCFLCARSIRICPQGLKAHQTPTILLTTDRVTSVVFLCAVPGL